MPEGPEVKTVARTLGEHLVGKKLGLLWHSPFRLRKDADYERLKKLENSIVNDVSCYGKVLFISANEKTAMMAQLGMTGQLKVETTKSPVAKHTHIRWPLKNTELELRYVDPRRFGLIDACDEKSKQHIINRLGPDPFSMSAEDYPALIEQMKKSSRAIKEILLDQSIVVGVGNIYASEALYRAAIHPERLGSHIGIDEYNRLIDAIIAILALAYKNCGTTFSNYVDGSGKRGKNLQFLKVFQRESEPCFQCQTAIVRIKQGGRSSFYCEICQK